LAIFRLRPRAQAHPAAQVIGVERLAQLRGDAVWSAGLEFRTVGLFEPTHGARVFDGGALPARADPSKWNLALAGVLDGVQPREMCFLGP